MLGNFRYRNFFTLFALQSQGIRDGGLTGQFLQ